MPKSKELPPLPELLAPAGNMEKLKIALHYGADAVYLGDSRFSLRTHAGFAREKLAEAVTYAHNHGAKVYVTANIFAHSESFANLDEHLLFLGKIGVDGLIIADPGILSVARRLVPTMAIHLSTQANVTNPESARFWRQQGVSRMNLARELSLAEIRQIRQATDAEIEIFVHGALCISYSGRCLLSYYLTGRDANQGNCAHPCRYSYALTEELRPDQYFPIEEDSHGTYILNSRDLCLLHKLPDLIAAGVNSLKIEGRMKSPYYVGATVRVYRAALDFIDAQRKTGEELGGITLPEELRREILRVGSRGYTENFLDQPPSNRDMLYHDTRVAPSHEPVGIVRHSEDNQPLIEIRNPLTVGEKIEYLGQNLTSSEHHITAIFDGQGNPVDKANPGNLVRLALSPAPGSWKENSLLRRQCRTA